MRQTRLARAVPLIIAVVMVVPLAYYLLVDLVVGDEACPVPGTDVTAHAQWHWWPPGTTCPRVHRADFTPPPVDRLWSVWLTLAGALLLIALVVRSARRRAV